jgi:hypothetical protein
MPVEFAYPPERRTHLLELLTLQSVLPSLPPPPQSYDLRELERSTAKETAWRVVPFSAERGLASELAFAAGDNAAVAIEQDSGTLVIRLASSEGVPAAVKSALENIIGSLSAVADGADAGKGREDVLGSIIRSRGEVVRERVRRELGGLKPGFEGMMGELDDFGSLVEPDEGSVLSNTAGVEEMLAEVYTHLREVAATEDDEGCEAEVRRLVEACYRASKSRVSFSRFPGAGVRS